MSPLEPYVDPAAMQLPVSGVRRSGAQPEHIYAELLAGGAAVYAAAGYYQYAKRLCLRAVDLFDQLIQVEDTV